MSDFILLIIISIPTIVSTILFILEAKVWIKNAIDRIEDKRRFKKIINKSKRESDLENAIQRYYR